MQKTELHFVIQVKEGKHFKQLLAIPTGVLQKNYAQAQKKAQDTLEGLKSTGLQYRMIKKYLPLKKDNMVEQLKLM